MAVSTNLTSFTLLTNIFFHFCTVEMLSLIFYFPIGEKGNGKICLVVSIHQKCSYFLSENPVNMNRFHW